MSPGEGLFFLELLVFFPETFNTTRCVNQFLFASKKWMTFGAYFNADIGFGRTNLYLVATRAPYAGISVVRMNAVFHVFSTPLIDLKLSIFNSPPLMDPG